MDDDLSRERWRRISAALDRLLELTPDLRPLRLVEVCGDDPDLERWVRALLEAADASADFLERPLRPETARRLLQISGLRLPSFPGEVPPGPKGKTDN